MGLFGNDKKKTQKAYGFLSYMNDCQKDNNSKYTDKELNIYNLENWEKEEIKNGTQKICDFEEEELEDDDYYSEDD